MGWLNDFTEMLKSYDIHVMAISVLDTTDSAVIRLVTNDPKQTAQLLKSDQLVLRREKLFKAVYDENEDSLHLITKSLLRAETY